MKTFIPLLALGIMGMAFAAEGPAFEEVDANADGMISQEEAATVEGLDFATCDENQDGSLSQEEYKACVAAE